jgi:hypothetical protein
MKRRIKDSVEGQFTRKILLICILIVSITFISGCIGEEKTDTGTQTSSQISIDSQTSDLLIKPSDLPKGYYTSEYTTYAISKGDSFEIRPNFNYYDSINSDDKYEGEIPKGKKRVVTAFRVTNDDNSIQSIDVIICESDSSSRLKEFMEYYISEKKQYGSKERELIETNLVGDNSVLVLAELPERAYLTFTFKNYLITIQTQAHEKETVREVTLKVAKAIERGLD